MCNTPFSVLATRDFLEIFRATCAHKLHVSISSEQLSSVTLNVDIQPSTLSGGYMGAYYALVIGIRDVGDLSDLPAEIRTAQFRYFAKALPSHDETLLEIMRVTGMSTRESEMYGALLPKLDTKPYPHNWSAKCYYNRQELLIFEDLAADRYHHQPERQFFDDAHTVAALRQLGALHASSIAYEHSKRSTGSTIQLEFGPYLTEPSFLLTNAWYVVGMEATVEIAQQVPQFEQRYAEKFDGAKLLERLFEVRKLLEVSARYRNVFSHRDLWGNNVMFQYAADDVERRNPTHTVFIDYQMCRYLPPAMDVLQLLYVCTRREQRDAKLPDYLRAYHDALGAALAEAGIAVATEVPWSELLESYEELKLYGIALACQYNPLTRAPNDAYQAMRLADPVRYGILSCEMRHDFIAEHMAKDQLYRDVVTENMEELLEFIYA